MQKNLIAKQSIIINAPVVKIWDALVNPKLIKQYLFGTQVVTNWKVGAPIIYHGEWQGRAYKDKGVILKIEPEKILQSTYWSSLSGLSDTPANYNTVTYKLSPVQDKTRLTVTQDNNATDESRKHSEQNWRVVLENIKKLLEK